MNTQGSFGKKKASLNKAGFFYLYLA